MPRRKRSPEENERRAKAQDFSMDKILSIMISYGVIAYPSLLL